MRSTLLAVLATLLIVLAPAAAGGASTAATYKGKAKSLAGDFAYGNVTVKRQGARVTRVKIQILSGSAKIKAGVMAVTYLADKTVEDQKTTLRVKFNGTRATGTFSETDICVDKGKFTAKR